MFFEIEGTSLCGSVGDHEIGMCAPQLWLTMPTRGLKMSLLIRQFNPKYTSWPQGEKCFLPHVLSKYWAAKCQGSPVLSLFSPISLSLSCQPGEPSILIVCIRCSVIEADLYWDLTSTTGKW